jgi:hypothetical protein
MLLSALVSSVVFPHMAFAQAPKGERTPNEPLAKELFAKGDAAYAEGRYEEALSDFQEAYALSSRPQLLFNISNALERLGRNAEAVEALERYLASNKVKERETVQKRVANLKKRVEEQKREQERIAREGEERWNREVEERKRLQGETPPPVAMALPEQPNQPSAAPSTGRTSGLSRTVPITLIAVGSAALVTGGIFGALTLSARGDVSNGCKHNPAGTFCSGESGAAIDRERTLGVVTDVAIGSGVVLAGVGLYWLLTRNGSADAKSARAPSSPSAIHVVGRAAGGGIEFGGTF